MSNFQSRLGEVSERITTALADLLGQDLLQGEIARPEQLVNAMRHGVLNGGKRLRPFLVIESAALFGKSGEEVIRTAMALECVHCYSLIHDDLPAMDNDELRRGQPTVHIAFDEATAILAGDSLLTLAFDLLANERTHKDAAIRCELVLQLARASGLGGMAGGQMLDLLAEGNAPDEAGTRLLQSMKTGALLRYACEAGAILGCASAQERRRLHDFGVLIGQAFQLADDILDVTATSEQMGKKTAKDAEASKGTLVSLYGVDKAKAMAVNLVEEAQGLLDPFGEKGAMLKACARYIVERGK
jgi:farnesyl diphosphate synthase